jgi:2-dehydro-3-deoxygalactonokinase
MAGSRNGLLEVPYLPTPADAGDWATGQRHARCGQFGIAISPGLRCVNAAGAPDVMRGEETQIFGALALEPSLRRGMRVMVLPGTHSKWVQLRDGAVAGFRTYITGELFALLKHHSTLLRAGTDTGATDGAFAAGLTRSESCGSGLAAALFEARTGQLLAGRTYAWAGEFLSGLLIGAEVHSALAHHADGPGDHPIMLVGDPGLTALYGQALAHYRNATVQADGAACAIAGLMRLAGLS